MKYQGKEIEILSRKSVFGKQLAEVKILSTGKVKSVPFFDLSDEKKVPTDAEIAFKAIAANIRSEVCSLLLRAILFPYPTKYRL